MEYGIVREMNRNLLEKYNNNNKYLHFYDYYLFHMSSMSLSLFRERNLETEHISLSQVFLVRSIIEDIAIMNMYEQGAVPSSSEYLLFGYQFLCEYKLYKDFELFDGVYVNVSKMKENYDYAKKEYSKAIGSSLKDSDFKKVLKSSLPFLGNNYIFDSMINLYCPDLLLSYKYFSIIVHPSEISAKCDFFDYDLFNKTINTIYICLEKYINKYYPNIISSKFTWNRAKNYFLTSPMTKALQPPIDIMNKIIDVVSKDKIINENNKYQLDYFRLIASDYASICYDFVFGFSEVLKSKIKPIYELCSVFYHSLKLDDKKIELTRYYSLINFKKEKCRDFSLDIDDGFKLFNELGFGSDKLKYKDLITKKSMPVLFGFKNINEYVTSMIDGLSLSTNQKKVYKLLYKESQLFSHGNGYMLSSNDDSFLDSESAYKSIDFIITELLKMFISYIEKLRNKKAIYDLKKLNGKLSESIFVKYADINDIKKKFEKKII